MNILFHVPKSLFHAHVVPIKTHEVVMEHMPSHKKLHQHLIPRIMSFSG